MTTLDDRPTTHTTDPHTPWRLRAACNGAPTTIFFPHRANSTEANTAAAYCQRCPVFDTCETDATNGHRTSGVWAGRYWDDGRDRPIVEPPRLATEERITLAKARRREALARWIEVRPRHHSAYATQHALAQEFGVTPETVKIWIKRARAEAAADYLAATAARSADTDTTERNWP